MDVTPNLNLPYLAAAQSQKHVTHNEALRALDAVVQLAVTSRTLTAPPATAVDGQRFIAGSAATGAWAGQSGKIAAWQDGAWDFYAPQPGWLVWVTAEAALVVWTGTAWISASASVNPTPLVGVNATADTTNRLSVKSPASLFDNVGNGHQLKLNKTAATDTASLLLQTSYSGRAELGLTGDDNFHFKVSADGATWNEAIVIDRTTGAVTLPHTNTLPVATASALGGVKQGSNITIAADGTLSALAATWDPGAKAPAIMLSNGGTTITSLLTSHFVSAHGARGFANSRTYFEFVFAAYDGVAGYLVGLSDATTSGAALNNYTGNYPNSLGYRTLDNLGVVNGGLFTRTAAALPATYSPVVGDVIACCVDMVAGGVWFGKNGVFPSTPVPGTITNAPFTFTPSASLILFPSATVYNPTDALTLNVGAPNLRFAIPSGFTSLG